MYAESNPGAPLFPYVSSKHGTVCRFDNLLREQILPGAQSRRMPTFSVLCRCLQIRQCQQAIIIFQSKETLNFSQEALRNEVMLPEDEPELVQLMIDYLYQLDYHVKETGQANGKLLSKSGEQPFDPAPYPVSPVAHNIEMFEDLSGPSAAPEMPDDGLRLLKRGKKNKKNKQLSWSSDGEFTVPEAAEPPLPCEALVEVEVPERRELRIHAQMYSLADKYGILDLKEVAMDKFAEEVSVHWENQGFLRAIEVVYASTVDTDKGLRKVVVEAIREHKNLLENSEVENCIKSVGGLAFDLLKMCLV